jgi:hypothetical protein
MVGRLFVAREAGLATADVAAKLTEKGFRPEFGDLSVSYNGADRDWLDKFVESLEEELALQLRNGGQFRITKIRGVTPGASVAGSVGQCRGTPRHGAMTDDEFGRGVMEA